MFCIPNSKEAQFKRELKHRILENNEQLLIPILSTLTSPMTRKIVHIYTDHLNGHKCTFIALKYPEAGEILRLFEGMESISEDDYIGHEQELENCKQIFQFWSVDFQKHRDQHLKCMTDVYAKGSLTISVTV